jgi:hypothetical protein
MTAWKPKVSLSFLGGMGWMLGLITGNNNGVSTVPLLVFSLPILPSKSFSLISKLKVKPKHETLLAYKKHRLFRHPYIAMFL